MALNAFTFSIDVIHFYSIPMEKTECNNINDDSLE